MATLVATSNPAAVIRDVFRKIPEIEQVHLTQDGDRGVTALIVINGKNYEVLNRIFESESTVINAIPGMSVNFDVVIRDGRPLAEVATPRGKLLFQR